MKTSKASESKLKKYDLFLNRIVLPITDSFIHVYSGFLGKKPGLSPLLANPFGTLARIAVKPFGAAIATSPQGRTRNFMAIILSMMVSSAVFAQTPVNGQNGPPMPQNGAQNGPPMPVAEETVRQTEDHFNGNFGEMTRRHISGGQIQKAWDEVDDKGGQFAYEKCDDCTYKMRLRQYMVSAITLPEGEKITNADIGDPDSFIVTQREDNKLTILPIGFGKDSSLLVFGEEGRLYAFYLRAESFNSKNVPDLVLRIKGVIPKKEPINLLPPEMIETSGMTTDISDLQKAALDDLPGMGEGTDKSPDDFVESVPFDVSKLHGFNDYELWGENWPSKMMPESVYRDEIFTYIHFGQKWHGLELPTAYTVTDDIDEMVNTRINGTTYIVESTHPLISLKSGKSFLCLKYTDET